MKHAGSVHETIRTEGWSHIKAEIRDRMDKAMRQLASVTRPTDLSDDALRGLISGLNWVLEYEVRVTRALAEIEADRKEQATEEHAVGSPMEPEESSTE